ncbi:MAG: YaiI/YqxD family protein [Acidiferrobacter sp.]
MKIWVDADACPVVVKEILFRAAKRARMVATFVANQTILVPASPYIKTLQVATLIDAADQAIVDRVAPEDLVITADIPLAALVVRKGAQALSPRGTLLDKETIGTHLAIRDFMTDLRNTGTPTGGPASLTLVDRQNFANRLDAWLARQPRS